MKAGFAVFFFALNLSVSAQMVVQGRVVDAASDEPLTGANIYLLADFRTGTASGAGGEFQLKIPAEFKRDTLLITFVGYEEQVLPIPEQPLVVRLHVREQDLMAVRIVAEPLIAEEFKVTKIQKLEIYTNPAAKADPLLAVNSLPSSTTTDESAAVSLRGSSPVETGIFLNNVPVYDAVRYSRLNGIGTFSLFNTSLVKNVVVFPGNPPLEFGNTTSGVVSIKTDDSSIQKNTTSLIISPANVGFQTNQNLGKIGLRTFSNYQPSGVLKFLNSKALERVEKFQSLDLGVYLFGSVGQRVLLKSYSYGLRENYVYDFIHPVFHGDFDQQKYRAFSVTNLETVTRIGTLTWNQGYSFSRARYMYSASAFAVASRAFFHGLNLYKKWEEVQVKTGLSWDHRSSRVDGEFFMYEYAIGRDHPTFAMKDKVEAETFEAFVYSKYYLGSKWILGGGLRKNLAALGENYLSKQANITCQVNNYWKVIGGIGDYNKQGIYENQAELLTIRSKQVSLDLFYDRGRICSTASFFAKQYDRNSTSGEVIGAEFFVDYQSAKWSGNASYTWLSAAGDNGPDVYDIAYFVKSNLAYKPGGNWNFSLNGLYRQGLLFHEVKTAVFNEDLDVFEPNFREALGRYPDYFILNLAASKLFPMEENLLLVVFASVNNIMDRKNVRDYRYNFNYSERHEEYFSKRLVYFGCQVSF